MEYIGNPRNKLNIKNLVFQGEMIEDYRTFPPVNLGEAQFVLKEKGQGATQEQVLVLCDRLLKGICSCWDKGGDYLGSATRTIIDWGDSISGSPWDIARGITMDAGLTSFLIGLKAIKETEEIWVLENNNDTFVWVVVEESGIELEMKYSDIFFQALEKYPSFTCGFMVFGRDEIKETSIPKNAILQ